MVTVHLIHALRFQALAKLERPINLRAVQNPGSAVVIGPPREAVT
jgi:hypothetical protein